MKLTKTILIAVAGAAVLYGAFFVYRYVRCNDLGVVPRTVCVCHATGSSMTHCAGAEIRRML